MGDGYETLIITFSEPIEVLDSRFEDIDTWGVDSLKKKWVDDTRPHASPDKRLYGSHHIRIQHEARKGMVGNITCP